MLCDQPLLINFKKFHLFCYGIKNQKEIVPMAFCVHVHYKIALKFVA